MPICCGSKCQTPIDGIGFRVHSRGSSGPILSMRAIQTPSMMKYAHILKAVSVGSMRRWCTRDGRTPLLLELTMCARILGEHFGAYAASAKCKAEQPTQSTA